MNAEDCSQVGNNSRSLTARHHIRNAVDLLIGTWCIEKRCFTTAATFARSLGIWG